MPDSALKSKPPGVTFMVSGLLHLLFTRCKHLAWVVMFAIGAPAFRGAT